MTADELDAIEAREKAATAGPWSALTGMLAYSPRLIASAGDECYIVQNDVAGPGLINDTQPDLAFIAHAREDVPALVAEVRRLRAIVDDIAGQIACPECWSVEVARGEVT
jgi:hypothetical protein